MPHEAKDITTCMNFKLLLILFSIIVVIVINIYPQNNFYVLGDAPADFKLSDLSVDSLIVQPGVTVEVSVKVSNVGEEFGSYTVKLEVNGTAIARLKGGPKRGSPLVRVELNGGESQTVRFLAFSEEAGVYLLSVEGLTTTFEVIEVESPEQESKPLPWNLIILSIIVIAAVGLYFVRVRAS